MSRDRLLACLLRFVGAIDLLAFGAVVMPREMMAESHVELGLGEFPPLGVVDFMIRQASYTYGMHGVSLWVLASDPQRYRPLVLLTGLYYAAAGPLFLWINTQSRMPRWWTIGDSAACFLIGISLLLLLAQTRESRTTPGKRRSAGPDARLSS